MTVPINLKILCFFEYPFKEITYFHPLHVKQVTSYRRIQTCHKTIHMHHLTTGTVRTVLVMKLAF